MTLNTLYNQDILIGIRSIPTESIDLVVTDCPYEIDEKYYQMALRNLRNTPKQTTLFE